MLKARGRRDPLRRGASRKEGSVEGSQTGHQVRAYENAEEKGGDRFKQTELKRKRAGGVKREGRK